jgi:hypothetical protein
MSLSTPKPGAGNASDVMTQSLLRAALCCLLLAVAPAAAQTIDERFFSVLSNQASVEQSCGFRVRSSEAGSMSRLRFILTLPDWTLSVTQLTPMPVTVTNAAVDTTLDQAADLLKVDQGAGDVNCCVDLQRVGSIGTFAMPVPMLNGTITTQAESDAIFALAADIKIVSGIQFCGQAGNYAGCADGNSIITVNTFNPPGTNVFTNPATVAHEVGHWSGLGHVGLTCTPTSGQCGTCTDCTDGFSNRVMYCSICGGGAPNQGIITSGQCTSYQSSAQ